MWLLGPDERVLLLLLIWSAGCFLLGFPLAFGSLRVWKGVREGAPIGFLAYLLFPASSWNGNVGRRAKGPEIQAAIHLVFEEGFPEGLYCVITVLCWPAKVGFIFLGWAALALSVLLSVFCAALLTIFPRMSRFRP